MGNANALNGKLKKNFYYGAAVIMRQFLIFDTIKPVSSIFKFDR